MTELSRFWNGTTVGDATNAPYDAQDEFAEVMAAYSRSSNYPNQGYVLLGSADSLETTVDTPTTIQVKTGIAILRGTYYKSDALTHYTVPNNPPSSATRHDRLVLRKDWANQQVRLVYLVGSPTTGGGAVPALVQTPGSNWDMPLYQIHITTGGVITLSDERNLSNIGAAPAGARSSLYVPWFSSADFPRVDITTSGGPFTTDLVYLSQVPFGATAVMLNFLRTSGAYNQFRVMPANNANNYIFEVLATYDDDIVYSHPFVVPLTTPQLFQVFNTTPLGISFFVQGWFAPA